MRSFCCHSRAQCELEALAALNQLTSLGFGSISCSELRTLADHLVLDRLPHPILDRLPHRPYAVVNKVCGRNEVRCTARLRGVCQCPAYFLQCHVCGVVVAVQVANQGLEGAAGRGVGAFVQARLVGGAGLGSPTALPRWLLPCLMISGVSAAYDVVSMIDSTCSRFIVQ